MPWQGQSLDRHIYDVSQTPGLLCVSYRLFYFMHLFKDLLETADQMVSGMYGYVAMQADLKSANVLGELHNEAGCNRAFLRGEFCDIGGIW
jgi:hypothetical protein